jgi:hypothetical protein
MRLWPFGYAASSRHSASREEFLQIGVPSSNPSLGLSVFFLFLLVLLSLSVFFFLSGTGLHEHPSD